MEKINEPFYTIINDNNVDFLDNLYGCKNEQNNLKKFYYYWKSREPDCVGIAGTNKSDFNYKIYSFNAKVDSIWGEQVNFNEFCYRLDLNPLPEKWILPTTKDLKSQQLIYDYVKSLNGYISHYWELKYVNSYYFCSDIVGIQKEHPRFTEYTFITFEEFEMFILKNKIPNLKSEGKLLSEFLKKLNIKI